MSGYPPSGYPPPYDPNAWRNQQRMIKAQQRAYQAQQKAQYRMQRNQMRMQARASRHGSLVGPVLLVALGVVFLFTQTGRISWSHAFGWYSHWWPAVLIGAGLLLLAEWTLVRQRQIAGQPYSGPVLGGGVVLLLVLLAVVGATATGINGVDWQSHFSGLGWDKALGEAHESDDSLSSSIISGHALAIRNPHGDVMVTGSSQDGQVHVSVHKQVYAWKDSDADQKARELEPVFSNDGAQTVLTVAAVDGGSADLTLEIPHGTPITIEAAHGDVNVSEVHAPVIISSDHGDIDMTGIDGPVTLRVSHDDASVTGHSMTGPVTLQGRTGDVSFSDIGGSVSLEGDFFGSTHLEHVNGLVRFTTSRTQFEAARLDGEFDVDGGADLTADRLMGPVKLTTHNRNITFDRVEGSVNIVNRNGTVNVTNAPPLSGITIVNEKGSVDVGLPDSTGFVVNASTQHGDLENDFGFTNEGSSDRPSIKGAVHGGGPIVSIVTTDGDVTVRKSSVAPLPPLAPLPPKVTVAPPPTPAPTPVHAPKPLATPKAPKAPSVAVAPQAPTAPGATK